MSVSSLRLDCVGCDEGKQNKMSIKMKIRFYDIEWYKYL